MRNLKEVSSPVRLRQVQGVVPSSLRGTYYRCGPGMFDEYGQRVNHPFDGDGYVSRVCFDGNGELPRYTARVIDTRHRMREQKAGRRLYKGAFGTLLGNASLKNPSNAAVLAYGSNLLTFYDSSAPYVLDPLTLDTRGPLRPFQEGFPVMTENRAVDFAGRKLGVFGDALASHPKIINNTLVLASMRHHLNLDHSLVTFYEMSPNLKVLRSKQVELDSFCYFHDFSVTDQYYVFLETPMRMDKSMMVMLGVASAIESDSGRVGKIHLVHRETGERRSMVVPFGFASHHVRCIATSETKVLLDCIWYSGGFNLHALGHNRPSHLCRIVANMDTNQASFQMLRDDWIELPATDTSQSLLFSTGCKEKHPQEMIVRTDLTGKAARQVWFDGVDFEQPVVADDRWVITTGHDRDHTVLYIFDAAHVGDGPVSTLAFPEALPPALHGHFNITQCPIREKAR